MQFWWRLFCPKPIFLNVGHGGALKNFEGCKPTAKPSFSFAFFWKGDLRCCFLKFQKKNLATNLFHWKTKSSISLSKRPWLWVRTVKTNHKVSRELPRLISLKNKCYPSAKEVSWEKLLAKLQNSSLLPSASWSDSWLRFLLKNFFNTRRKKKWRQNYFLATLTPKITSIYVSTLYFLW